MPPPSEEKTEVLAGGDPRLQPRLGRYRLERRIGAGGMAEIFLARVDGPGGFEKQVVVKRIRPQLSANPKFVEMFLREARVLSRLDHPNIVRIIELDEQNGEYFLALEYLDGLSLRDMAERHWAVGRSLAIETVVRIVADACLGLEHAHNFGDGTGPLNLVHRDVSPDNLFVTATGAVKVLDFGIAKLEGIDNLTQAGELKGKVPFMSPEQLMGKPLDARADLFSVGIVLYWLLTGRRPFDGVSDVHTMKAILEDPPVTVRSWNPRVPVVLEQIVLSLLEKDRDRRIGSAGALHDALMTLLVGLPRTAPEPATLVAAARGLPPVAHEVTPPGLAAVPSTPWPEGAAPLPRNDIADAATRARFVLSESSTNANGPDPIADDPHVATQKIDIGSWRSSRETSDPNAPSWSQEAGDFESATDVVAQKDLLLPSTDEHRRVSGGGRAAPIATSTSTEAMRAKASISLTDPSDPVQMAKDRAAMDLPPDTLPPDGPPTDESVRPPPPPATEESAAEDAGAAVVDNLDGIGDGIDHGPATVEQPVLPPLTSDERALISPPSRALPVFAGVATAAIVVVLGLWISGAGARLAAAFGFKDEAFGLQQDALADGGVVVADSGVITTPQFDDAGPDLVDAGTAAAADAGGAPAADAGEAREPDAGPDVEQTVDAGTREGRDDGKKPPAIKRRVIATTGPRNISWQGPNGEVYGAGRDTLRIPESVRTVVAVDTRRGGRTKIPVDKGVGRIDYARLPQQELNIRVRPYAEVFLGKERLGLTPLNPVRVTVGTYEVRFVYGKVTKTMTVEVKAEKPAVLNVVMTK